MEEQEKAPYGYCTNCAEPFDKPYTHCPFCNAPNPHLEKDLETKKTRVEELLAAQMAANRAWADMNREEVTMQVEAQHEQNLEDMKQQLRNPGSLLRKGKTKTPAPSATPAARPEDSLGRAFGMKPQNPAPRSKGLRFWGLLLLGGVVLLVVGLVLILK